METCSNQYMHVEQAVFASSNRGSIKGYQLVSKSAGVDRSAANELCRWAPTQFPSTDPGQWTINYFPLSDDTVAVTRTVLGGREYSGRGGMQVVTLILLLRNEQFESYNCNPISLAKTALAMGCLKLPLAMDQALPQATLPRRAIIESPRQLDLTEETDPDCLMLDEITVLVKNSRRVAVVGAGDGIDVIARLMPRLSPEVRREFSFTTGLSPTVCRPFQAHFLASCDITRQRALASQNIVCVHAA